MIAYNVIGGLILLACVTFGLWVLVNWAKIIWESINDAYEDSWLDKGMWP